MAKSGEVNLPEMLGDVGRRHAFDKPFSDALCGRYLRDIGTAIELLPPPPARVLDLGVGSGWTSVFLARRGYTVTAQDISAGMIAMARSNRDRHQARALELVVQDYETMDFDNEFDAAVFFDSLHHAENEAAAMSAVFRALRTGGVCITAEPGKGHAAATSSREFTARFGVTEKDMHPGRIIALARSAGFRKVEVFERLPRARRLFEGPAAELPRTPSRWKLGFLYLGRAARCLAIGAKQRDPGALGLIPAKTFEHANFVRLTK